MCASYAKVASQLAFSEQVFVKHIEHANDDMVAITRRERNLYQMTFTNVCGADAANFVRSRMGGNPLELWGRRLKHLNVSIYVLQIMVRGINLSKTFLPTSTLVCDTCIEGKQYAAKLRIGKQ